MSSKRVKQYLLLLTAIGLIAIASGGSGTFASFTAEVNNPGNTFATGSLFLHDSVTNLQECTSESAASNSNTAETPGTGHACDTLFTVPNSTFAPNGTLNGSLSGTVTSIPVNDWNGGTTGLSFAIANGAEVQIDDGVNTDVCTANGAAAAGATSITVNSCVLGSSYSSGALVESEGPFIAHLTLRNAGTIDAKNLSFALDSVAHTGGCDQTLPGLNASTTLCQDTNFTITETDASFTASINATTGDTTGAEGCAFGTASGGGCVATSKVLKPGAGGTSTQNPTTFSGSWTPLVLSSGGGTNNVRQPIGVDSVNGHASGSGPGSTGADPGTGLTNPGGARYFLVEIWPGSLTNDDMGASATFDLIWHTIQA